MKPGVPASALATRPDCTPGSDAAPDAPRVAAEVAALVSLAELDADELRVRGVAACPHCLRLVYDPARLVP